jgi:hypothetical protein
MYESSGRRWAAAGFDVTRAGSDIPSDEWGDLIHFMPAGGNRLAAALAPRVRALAERVAGGHR